MCSVQGAVRTLVATAILGLGLAACGGGSTPPVGGSGLTTQGRLGADLLTKSATVASVPSHIPTWVYDEYWGPGQYATSAQVQQYVTYAQGGNGNAKEVTDCDSTSVHNCNSVFYFDPNFNYASTSCPSAQATSLAASADESWYVHETGYTDTLHRAHGIYSQNCNGSQIQIPVYLLNDGNPAVQGFFANYLRSTGDQFDYYWMDDTSGRVLTQAYGPGGGFCQDATNHYCWNTQEYPTDDSVAQAHGSFANALNHASGMPMQFFFNGVGFSGSTPTNLNVLQSSNRYMGAVCENCVVNAGQLRPTMYAKVLNAMAAIDALPSGAFIEFNTGFSADGSSDQLSQRRVTIAVAWLGFAPGRTIVSENLEDTTSNLAVWPEEMIYPTQPLQSMTTGAADLQVAPGVYRREFAACYNNSVLIGPCAAILNANSTAATVQSSWLSGTYKHLITMTGGDVTNGGTVNFTSAMFVPGITTIQPGFASLIFQ